MKCKINFVFFEFFRQDFSVKLTFFGGNNILNNFDNFSRLEIGHWTSFSSSSSTVFYFTYRIIVNSNIYFIFFHWQFLFLIFSSSQLSSNVNYFISFCFQFITLISLFPYYFYSSQRLPALQMSVRCVPHREIRVHEIRVSDRVRQFLFTNLKTEKTRFENDVKIRES